MKFHSIILVAVSATLIGSSAQAAVLASYQFTSGSAVATTSDANLTAGSFSFNAAMANSNTGFSGTGENIFARVNGTSQSTLANAITNNQYVTVTITPDSGFQLNLTNLTIDLGYSLNAASIPAGVGVSLNASVFSSVDGFTSPDVLGTKSFTAADQGSGNFYENLDINLSGAAYQGLSGPLEFRIYLYDSTNTPTQPIHRIDNFILNGAVAAIPEPSAALLGGLGLLVLLRRRR